MPSQTLIDVKAAGEDFEWYPTTDRMIAIVAQNIPSSANSILDIGAGDGRVLAAFARRATSADLYAIEKSSVLIQAQPEEVTPVGTDLFEQNLACLPVDYIFCNPPYSQYEVWADTVIASGYAKRAYLVIPKRWSESKKIERSLASRGATARVIHSDNFLDAERRARAEINIVEIMYPRADRRHEEVKDPFDIWFDQNIDTFDRYSDPADDEAKTTGVARLRKLGSAAELVEAYNDEYARMEKNYRAIFELDAEILRELGVSKDNVRDWIKAKMSGLKIKYWQVLFERLDVITKRMSTATKARFLDRIAGRTAIAFTGPNTYAVVMWAIKHANRYFDEQVVLLFRAITTFDGVENYASNRRVWQKRDGWRYHAEDMSHYALDYRIVISRYAAIRVEQFRDYDYPGGLHRGCHELLDDIRAVLGNLGYLAQFADPEDKDAYAEAEQGWKLSRDREWLGGKWQDFYDAAGKVIFQAKAFKNGNIHMRFMPDAIKALNVEAGRLLGWIQSPEDVVRELGYTEAEADRFYRSSLRIGVKEGVRLLK